MNSPDIWNRHRPPPEGNDQGGSRSGFYLWIAIVVLGALALWQLDRLFPGERTPEDKGSLIQNGAILLLLSSGLIFIRRFNFRETARNMAMWGVVFSVIALGYAYQNEVKSAGTRVMSELVPGYAVASASGEVVLTENQGHFIAIAEANGTPVVFMIDTGATEIVLSPSDARRIGLDPDLLDYTRAARTANGIVRAAPARLSRLKLNQIELTDVPVTVNAAEMDTSLLGMAFLRRLKSYEVRGRQLYLRW